MKYLTDVQIASSVFIGNDPGPLLDNRQTENKGLNVRASAISIHGKVITTSIEDCRFINNSQNWIKDYIQANNTELYNFFPPQYFEASHSPVIKYHGQNNGQIDPALKNFTDHSISIKNT